MDGWMDCGGRGDKDTGSYVVCCGCCGLSGPSGGPVEGPPPIGPKAEERDMLQLCQSLNVKMRYV